MKRSWKEIKENLKKKVKKLLQELIVEERYLSKK
jgi:hypothetical protein